MIEKIKKWFPLVILSLGITIIILDTTILNVSLRTIITDLKTDIQSIQWVITAYSLMLASFTITGGRLGDLFGRKNMFMLGAIIFAVGSFLASVSTNVTSLILGEAIIEGAGAALMMPSTMSLIASNYQGRDRQIGFGVWGAIAGGAAALGPVVGGWLTTYFSWRWAFRINVGVVLILLIGSLFISREEANNKRQSLDFVGVILSAFGLFLLSFGFIKASDFGWLVMKDTVTFLHFSFDQGTVSLTPILIFLGGIVLALFAAWELYMENLKKTPLVSLSIFKNIQFSLAVVITSILAFAQAGLSFSVPVFLQAVKHLDAFATGVAMLPMTLTILFVAPFSAYISKYTTPKRIVQAGLFLGTLGFILLRFGINSDYSQWALAPGYLLFGAGMGCMMSQLSNLAISSVSVSEAGEVSGVNGTFRTVGQTLGSAVIGALLLSSLSSNLVTGVNQSAVIPEENKSILAQTMSEETSQIEFGGEKSQVALSLPPVMLSEITRITQSATVDATHTTLYISAGLMLLALLLSIPLPNKKNIESKKQASAPH